MSKGRVRSLKLHIWVKPDKVREFNEAREIEGHSRDGAFEKAMGLYVDAHNPQEVRR